MLFLEYTVCPLTLELFTHHFCLPCSPDEGSIMVYPFHSLRFCSKVTFLALCHQITKLKITTPPSQNSMYFFPFSFFSIGLSSTMTGLFHLFSNTICLEHQDALKTFFEFINMNLTTMQMMSAWYPDKTFIGHISTINMHFLLDFSKIMCSFQYQTLFYLFFPQETS